MAVGRKSIIPMLPAEPQQPSFSSPSSSTVLARQSDEKSTSALGYCGCGASRGTAVGRCAGALRRGTRPGRQARRAQLSHWSRLSATRPAAHLLHVWDRVARPDGVHVRDQRVKPHVGERVDQVDLLAAHLVERGCAPSKVLRGGGGGHVGRGPGPAGPKLLLRRLEAGCADGRQGGYAAGGGAPRWSGRRTWRRWGCFDRGGTAGACRPWHLQGKGQGEQGRPSHPRCRLLRGPAGRRPDGKPSGFGKQSTPRLSIARSHPASQLLHCGGTSPALPCVIPGASQHTRNTPTHQNKRTNAYDLSHRR